MVIFFLREMSISIYFIHCLVNNQTLFLVYFLPLTRSEIFCVSAHTSRLKGWCCVYLPGWEDPLFWVSPATWDFHVFGAKLTFLPLKNLSLPKIYLNPAGRLNNLNTYRVNEWGSRAAKGRSSQPGKYTQQ